MYNKIFLKYYSPETLLFSWYLTFSFSLLDCSLLSFPQRSCTLLSISVTSFIGLFLALISTTVLLLAKLSGIFFFTLSVSSPPPPLYLNSGSWGMSVLLRLSYMHLMWHRLGKNPLINAEVRIFNFLLCSGSFPWSWVSSGSYTWIIGAPCFK